MGSKHLPRLTLPREPAMLAYIAGIVDGEGCISIDAVKSPATGVPCHNMRVCIANTSERLMVWLQSRLGGTIKLAGRRTAPKHWLPVYQWCVHGKNAQILIMAILPFLVVKQDQAIIALEFSALPSGKRGNLPLDQRLIEQREALAQKLSAAKRQVN